MLLLLLGILLNDTIPIIKKYHLAVRTASIRNKLATIFLFSMIYIQVSVKTGKCIRFNLYS